MNTNQAFVKIILVKRRLYIYIYIVDTWLKELDSGNLVGTTFLDLSKAFDLVDHEIILLKLKLYHFSETSTKVFKSYL